MFLIKKLCIGVQKYTLFCKDSELFRVSIFLKFSGFEPKTILKLLLSVKGKG